VFDGEIIAINIQFGGKSMADNSRTQPHVRAGQMAGVSSECEDESDKDDFNGEGVLIRFIMNL
jgi:hypothetical protein